MYRRRAGMAVAAAVVLLGLAGCAANEPADPGASASAVAQDGTAAFAAATSRLRTEPIRFQMGIAGQFSSHGTLDTKARRGQVFVSMQLKGKPSEVEAVISGEDVWLHMPATGVTKWMHIAAAEVKGTSFDVSDPVNPAGVMSLINAVNKVEKTASGFSGTVDMTKSMSGAGGAALKAVPFDAGVDDKGRVSRVTVDLSGLMAGAKFVAVYEYGVTVVAAPPPAAQVIEMPAEVKALIVPS